MPVELFLAYYGSQMSVRDAKKKIRSKDRKAAEKANRAIGMKVN